MIRDLLGMLLRASTGVIVREFAREFRARLQRLLQLSPGWEHRSSEFTVLGEHMSRFGGWKEVLIWFIVKRAARLSDVHIGLDGPNASPT